MSNVDCTLTEFSQHTSLVDGESFSLKSEHRLLNSAKIVPMTESLVVRRWGGSALLFDSRVFGTLLEDFDFICIT